MSFTIDRRSIKDVQGRDLHGFIRCHFFAGIAGWELALRLAGWPVDREVWTGSCPCQSLSVAGKQLGEKDERHLWPEFYRLISECRPATIFGEQVASKDGLEWLDGVALDLEELGYAFGASDLPAASVKAPQTRQRFWWVASLADAEHSQSRPRNGQGRSAAIGRDRPPINSDAGIMANAAGLRGTEQLDESRERRSSGPNDAAECARPSELGNTAAGGQRIDGSASGDAGYISQPNTIGRMGDACNSRLSRRSSESRDDGSQQSSPERTSSNAWRDTIIIPCRDNRRRRISAQPGDEPLAYGIPNGVGRFLARLESMGVDTSGLKRKEVARLVQLAKRNRVGRLRGNGNAIVAEVAAEFIRGFLEAEFTAHQQTKGAAT